MVKLKKNRTHPVVLSEFGGYCLGVAGHTFNLDTAYGYASYESADELAKALENLYGEQIVPALQKTNLCALVLTQLSDVEDETNGLVTYDRACVKVDAERMCALAKALNQAFL